MLNQFSRTARCSLARRAWKSCSAATERWATFMTFRDASKEFELDCKVRHLSPKTIDNYTKQLW